MKFRACVKREMVIIKPAWQAPLGELIFPNALILHVSAEILSDLKIYDRFDARLPNSRLNLNGRPVRCLGFAADSCQTLFTVDDCRHYYAARIALWVLARAKRIGWVVANPNSYFDSIRARRNTNPDLSALTEMIAEMKKRAPGV